VLRRSANRRLSMESSVSGCTAGIDGTNQLAIFENDKAARRQQQGLERPTTRWSPSELLMATRVAAARHRPSRGWSPGRKPANAMPHRCSHALRNGGIGKRSDSTTAKFRPVCSDDLVQTACVDCGRLLRQGQPLIQSIALCHQNG
jgi:hypothetical protein